jgi:ABC-type uncharacterized transport system permease subunit
MAVLILPPLSLRVLFYGELDLFTFTFGIIPPAEVVRYGWHNEK